MSLTLGEPGVWEEFPGDHFLEVVPGLYLGNRFCVETEEKLQENRIEHVINVSGKRHPFPHSTEDYSVLEIPTKDDPFENISQHFARTNALIEEILEKNENYDEDEKTGVLIYCQQSLSRSTSFAVAFLIYAEGLTTTQAILKLKSKRVRRTISPNVGYLSQLVDYENSLYSGRLRFVRTFSYGIGWMLEYFFFMFIQRGKGQMKARYFKWWMRSGMFILWWLLCYFFVGLFWIITFQWIWNSKKKRRRKVKKKS